MRDLEKKIKISLIFFPGIAIFLIFFLIYPLFKEIKKSSQELFLIKKELILVQEKTKKAPILKEKFLNRKSEIEKIKNLFVDPEMPIDFFKFLEEIAKDSNIQITISLLPEKTKEKTIFPFLNFKVSLKGSFSNCLKFLEKLENAPYLIEIDELNSKRLKKLETEKETFGEVEFNLTIKIFTQSENKI